MTWRGSADGCIVTPNYEVERPRAGAIELDASAT